MKAWIKSIFKTDSSAAPSKACHLNQVEKTESPNNNIVTKDSEPQVGTRRWAKAAAGAILAMSPIAYQLNTQPPEGSGIEVHQDSFIKDTVEAGDPSKWNHSKKEELGMIQEAYDWSLKQLENNGFKVGQGNFGNTMFNIMHNESYQKCEEQNSQVIHLMAHFLDKKEYKPEKFKVGLAFAEQYIGPVSWKKHVWLVVVPKEATEKALPKDSRNLTEGIYDPWKGHKTLQDPMSFKDPAGNDRIPESVEWIHAGGGSSYWD
jgi:hypothetical protein